MRRIIALRSGFVERLQKRVFEQVLEPMRTMRAAYLPFLMVYFAYGLTGVTSIAGMVWTKEVLHLSATDLQLAAFWAGVPWTLKMLFGQFVDVRPILGSPRRSYIFTGAACVLFGYIVFAGLAGGWPIIVNLGTPLGLYFLAAVIVAVGLVVQDVTADAMTSEMNTGDERDARSIQVLGRIAVASGGLIAAIFAGALALVGRHGSYETVYLIACGVPMISVLGAILWKQRLVVRARWNTIILYGGVGFAFFVIAIQFIDLPAKAEIVWLGSALAVGIFLYVLMRQLDREAALALIATAVVAFVFRSMPSAGPGVAWWEMDVLGFDEEFFGWLQTIGSILGLLGLVFAARSLRNYSVAPVLALLTVAGTVLMLPILGMYYGLHHWTEAHFGFGARTIAIIDVTAESPFAQLSMVPILAFIAMVARFGNPATWFALAASFMNLALSTSSITTKWLTQIFPVSSVQRDATGAIIAQGDFGDLGVLMILTTTLGFILPLLAIWVFRKQLNYQLNTPSPPTGG